MVRARVGVSGRDRGSTGVGVMGDKVDSRCRMSCGKREVRSRSR